MTWNVHGSARPSVRGLAEQVRSAAADVVLLQEVQRRQAHAIASLLRRSESGWSVRWSFKHGPVALVAEGLAVLSRFPIDSLTTALISQGANRFTFRRRIAQIARVRASERVVSICNTHFASGASGERPAQFARLLPSLAGVELFGGDFNDLPGSALIAAVAGQGFKRADSFESAWAAVNRKKPLAPNLAIDHMFAREPWVFDEPHRFDTNDIVSLRKLSDHLPVVVKVRRGDSR